MGQAQSESSSALDGARGLGRSIWVFFVLVAVAFAVMGWFGASLTFDGSKYFLKVVEERQTFHYFARTTGQTFQYPTLWASSHTSSVPLLRHVFGLSYAVAPFGALLASWLVVRRRAPGLMVWPVLGIGIAALPGLLFPVSESVIVAEWAWPLVLVTLVALDGFSLVAGAGIAAFLFFLHPQSLFVFLAVAVISTIRARLEPALRRRLIAWASVMLVATVLAYVWHYTDISKPGHSLSPTRILNEFSNGELGLPFLAYFLAFCAGLALLALRHSPMLPVNRWTRLIPAALVALAGICMVVYASNASLWTRAADARDLVIFLELPFVILAVLDQLRPASEVGVETEPDLDARGPIVIVTGIALCISLVVWSAGWSSETGALARQLAATHTYCVAPSAVGQKVTADSLYKEELAIDLQTRTPAHIVIPPAGCLALRRRGVLTLVQLHFRVNGGWFHFASSGFAFPAITSFSPTSGPVGTVVTITGSHLDNATKVSFHGVSGTITKNTTTTIKVMEPAGATTGKIKVVTAGGKARTTTVFTVP